jgi:CHAD domain-containing protein
MSTRPGRKAHGNCPGGKGDGRGSGVLLAVEATAASAVREPGRLPAGTVAVTKLRAELGEVWQEIGEAGDPLADPEAVHRLRVATRRSLAALAAFAPLISPRNRRRFQRRLRQVRRAASEARDLDVLIDRLRQQWPTAGEDPLVNSPPERLIGLLSDQQIGSRGPIRDCQAELLAWEWPVRQDKLLGTVALGSQKRYGEFARKRLRRLGRKFFAAAGPFRKAEQVHQFRIMGKRLRYSLDLFADVLAPQPRERCLRQLKKIQGALGDFTDHAAAADRLTDLTRESLDPATILLIDTLRREEHQLARLAHRRFDSWWTTGRRKKLRTLFREALQS